jgi:hypothetical protein
MDPYNLIWCVFILSDFMKFAAATNHPLGAASFMTPLDGALIELEDFLLTSPADCTEAITALKKAMAASQERHRPVASTAELCFVAAEEVAKVSMEDYLSSTDKQAANTTEFSNLSTFDDSMVEGMLSPKRMFHFANFKRDGDHFWPSSSIDKDKFTNIILYTAGEKVLNCTIIGSHVDFYDAKRVDYWYLSDKPSM